MKPSTIFETPRLRLRPPALDDAAAIFTQYAQDAEVAKYLTWRPHENIQMTQEFLKQCISSWEKATSFPWVITRKEDQRFLGMVELRMKIYKAELGYVLARPYWGQGFMTEAARVVIDWALASPNIYRVWATCDVDNLASARIMEKIGMKREGLLRRWLIHPMLSSEPRDSWCYAKVK